MQVVSGTLQLKELLDLLNPLLNNHYLNNEDPTFSMIDKIDEGYYQRGSGIPILFTVPKGTLSATTHESNLGDIINDVFYILDIEYLYFLQTLSSLDQKKYQMDWIVFESNRSIIVAGALKWVAILDFWQDRASSSNSVGRLDYEKMERYYTSIVKNIFNIFKRKSQNFIVHALGLNLSSRKRKPIKQELEYVKQELKYYESPKEIVIDEHLKKMVFAYICPICGSTENIVLTGSDHTNFKSTRSVMTYNKVTENVEYECRHKEKEWESEICSGFHGKIMLNGLKEDDDFDKAFLYLFYWIERQDDSIRYIRTVDIIEERTINQYIEYLKKTDK